MMKTLIAITSMASALFVLNSGSAAVRYVDVNSTNPSPPYFTWATAATTIQEAVDAAIPGDQILVKGGVYQTGGSVVLGSLETNRVTVNKAVAIRSVNGPAFTTIRGFNDSTTNVHTWVRCVYLGAGASLSGFTLTGGGTATEGGGILCQTNTAVLSNCVLSANLAKENAGGASGGTLNNCTLSRNRSPNGAGAYESLLNNCTLSENVVDLPGIILDDDLVFLGGTGGGATQSVLSNCLLFGNHGGEYGGGVYRSTLFNCLLVRNGATQGGGADSSSLVNCTVVSNRCGALLSGPYRRWGAGTYNCMVTNSVVYYNYDAIERLDNFSGGVVSYSCTTPHPTNGVGSITNAPLFVNLPGGDLHLQPGSPGIDAGMDLGSLVTNDLAGMPRPLDGNHDGVAGFDMGAYEFNPLLLTSISKIGTNLRVCWSVNVPGMKLQTSSLMIDGSWSDVTVPTNATCLEFPLTSSNAFFRLLIP